MLTHSKRATSDCEAHLPPSSEILILCGFPTSEFPRNLTADYVKSVAYNLPEERTLTTQDYICFVAMSIN
ncbi:hypothetical protein D0Y65_037302 [Glycine soja]|uniref:Uncharacterized protein n=1 Tax=Glycine soja TaxID=3848 RepID=A0A445GZQ3_GLYSO|nr:hypothetical protein D0Y65_037302 [Glycine soja]